MSIPIGATFLGEQTQCRRRFLRSHEKIAQMILDGDYGKIAYPFIFAPSKNVQNHIFKLTVDIKISKQPRY